MLPRPGVPPVPQEAKPCCLADGAQAAVPAYQALHLLVHGFMAVCSAVIQQMLLEGTRNVCFCLYFEDAVCRSQNSEGRAVCVINLLLLVYEIIIALSLNEIPLR